MRKRPFPKFRKTFLSIGLFMLVVCTIYTCADGVNYSSVRRYANNQTIENITGIPFPEFRMVEYLPGPVCFNGDFSDTLKLEMKEPMSDSAIQKAKEVPTVQAAIDGKTIVKEIYVKGKIINIVVK